MPCHVIKVKKIPKLHARGDQGALRPESSYSGNGATGDGRRDAGCGRRESANDKRDKQCALSLRSCIDSAAIVMAMVRAAHPHVSGEWVMPLTMLVPGHNVDDENVRIVFRFSEF